MRMDLPLERTANTWKMWWTEKSITPFDDKSKKLCLNQSAVRTRRIALLGNEKSNLVRLGSHAANQ